MLIATLTFNAAQQFMCIEPWPIPTPKRAVLGPLWSMPVFGNRLEGEL